MTEPDKLCPKCEVPMAAGRATEDDGIVGQVYTCARCGWIDVSVGKKIPTIEKNSIPES